MSLFNVSTLAQRPTWITHPRAHVRDYLEFGPRGCRAKGFKLMYDHLSCREFDVDHWPPYISERIKQDIEKINDSARMPLSEIEARFEKALSLLRNERKFRVIHLCRRNLLDSLISMKRAFIEDNWIGKPYDNQSVELSVTECESYFSETIAQQRRHAELFDGCAVYNVVYEDLVDDTDRIAVELQEFLGLPIESSLTATIKKQSDRDRSALLKNYDELKEHFEGTEWRKFFT